MIWGQINPWMAHEEIKFIKDMLIRLRPEACLEWGAGYSTLYFPKFIPKKSTWLSIEHEPKWHAKIRSMNNRKNVKIFHVEPNHFPWQDKHNDGTYADLKDYVEFPSKIGKFDFILVDGRARSACLYKAHELLNAKGIVVLHDAEREFYHEPLSQYKYQAFFSGYGNGKRKLWIGSREINVEDMFLCAALSQ